MLPRNAPSVWQFAAGLRQNHCSRCPHLAPRTAYVVLLVATPATGHPASAVASIPFNFTDTLGPVFLTAPSAANITQSSFDLTLQLSSPGQWHCMARHNNIVCLTASAKSSPDRRRCRSRLLLLQKQDCVTPSEMQGEPGAGIVHYAIYYANISAAFGITTIPYTSAQPSQPQILAAQTLASGSGGALAAAGELMVHVLGMTSSFTINPACTSTCWPSSVLRLEHVEKTCVRGLQATI